MMIVKKSIIHLKAEAHLKQGNILISGWKCNCKLTETKLIHSLSRSNCLILPKLVFPATL